MSICRLRVSLAVVFWLLIALPFIQKATHVFPQYPLNGVEKKAPKPEWTLRNWFDGSAARQFDAYFARKIGFRGWVVRAINQFNFTVFGKITGNKGTPIVVGKDDWLFEGEYVKHYKRQIGMSGDARRHFVSQLARLQELLSDRGIGFLLVISPSKAEIYPEYLPDDCQRPEGEGSGQRAYSLLLPELKEAGIQMVDVHALFKEIKPDSEMLFAKTGTHWNYFGSLLACREMLRALNQSAGLDIPLPAIPSSRLLEPVGTDTDLLLLLNLLWFRKGLTPYPDVRVDAEPMLNRPKLLVVGDSFTFTMVDSIKLAKAAGEIDLLYYFKRLYAYPAEDPDGYVNDHAAADQGSLDHENLDWEHLLFDKQAVILEANEILLPSRGWGFVEAAVEALEKAAK